MAKKITVTSYVTVVIDEKIPESDKRKHADQCGKWVKSVLTNAAEEKNELFKQEMVVKVISVQPPATVEICADMCNRASELSTMSLVEIRREYLGEDKRTSAAKLAKDAAGVSIAYMTKCILLQEYRHLFV